MIPFLMVCATSIVADDKVAIPYGGWQIRKATNASDCVNLAGEYQQWSEDRPKGSKMPFSVSEMVGPYLSYYDRKRITRVMVEHRDGNEITFTFFTQDGILTQRKYSLSNDVNISCTPDRVTIKRSSVETKGEATSGTADIIYTLFQADDGSLIVHKIIKSVQNVLFFFKVRNEEEDWVRFKPIEKR
jgi:hypothetical protein